MSLGEGTIQTRPPGGGTPRRPLTPPIWYQQKRGLAVNATQEQWRPVVGHEGSYEVSNLGHVRSVDRILSFKDGRARRARGRDLKPWAVRRTGHLCVGLTSSRRSLVHVLVLEAFVGPRPDGLVACHNNGIASDNRIDNLRWDTYGENNKDLVRHGTHWQTIKTHCPQGHEYTAENTRIYHNPNGWLARSCKTCALISSRAAKARKRAQRPADWTPLKSGARRQTHCNRGHEFTPQNTYERPDGKGRSCIKCQGVRARGDRN